MFDLDQNKKDIFSLNWFVGLESELRKMGQDSDDMSFDEIKSVLYNKPIVSADEFAIHTIYVVLAGGFSQKIAKRIHVKIIEQLRVGGANINDLLAIFNNKTKINSICKIWLNREYYCNSFYALTTDVQKINFLTSIPHIGKITANHLARNLGIDVCKYDIWIQRIGVLFSKNDDLKKYINNTKLHSDIKVVCDNMFTYLCGITGLPRGYIDVVLWKACQIGLIKL